MMSHTRPPVQPHKGGRVPYIIHTSMYVLPHKLGYSAAPTHTGVPYKALSPQTDTTNP